MIVGMNDDGLGLLLSPVVTVRVRLRDGEEITAGLNCCTACLGRLEIGDEVRVSDSSDGYVVDLPWFRSRCSETARLDSAPDLHRSCLTAQRTDCADGN